MTELTTKTGKNRGIWSAFIRKGRAFGRFEHGRSGFHDHRNRRFHVRKRLQDGRDSSQRGIIKGRGEQDYEVITRRENKGKLRVKRTRFADMEEGN